MQNWTIATAEKWEELTGNAYGQFFELLAEPAKRKAKDLVNLLVCEAYNNNPALDVAVEVERLRKLPMTEIWSAINALYKTEPVDEEKKST
jgi:hypothetical protein